MWKDLWDTAISELTRAKVDRRHPFRFFTLGTIGAQHPELRTVVLRDFDNQEKKLYLYTDSRTPKVREISECPLVSCLFYYPKKQLQVRMRAEATLISDQTDLYSQHLQKVKSSKSIQDYTTIEAPGTITKGNDVEYAVDHINFALIECSAVEFDILQLSRKGHQRCSVVRSKDRTWKGKNLIP